MTLVEMYKLYNAYTSVANIDRSNLTLSHFEELCNKRPAYLMRNLLGLYQIARFEYPRYYDLLPTIRKFYDLVSKPQ